VEFDAPLVGIWSPPGKSAPFVCLEPWYGRCDCEEFDGELKDREYGNTIAAGETFEAEYKIKIS
jgi:galactose mutarotase-like enzyme